MLGSLIVRTATRWLAIPTRTSRGNFCSANRSLIASPRTPGSWTSPSRTAPEASGAIPNLWTVGAPLTETSVTAMLPASMSIPTMPRERPSGWVSGFFLIAGSFMVVGERRALRGLNRREGRPT